MHPPRLLALTTALALCASVATAQSPQTTAELKNATGQAIGKVTLVEAPKGVLLKVEVKGLAPGWHGLHFHEKADCSKADFTSAGAHTSHGGDRVHGLLNPKANETGDLPNIYVAADGTGSTEVFSSLVTLGELKDADGSAVLIHAGADDHQSQPIGGAGARVACAEVR
ncbi:MAG: superoxide dismutase family protein [Alphaproteobacteria bacterium]|nr:superoxide dismutase family protein [Alphaproteobacteria bacterium]MBU1515779.1 superoxide dismutase family protein [Alphaproteobacteria bacterium]MBU2094001.1 superoxide dismutase family protein [Alphaproteobacteria bacterium]MBU2153425.1 superoxide dismutase family protein [Alphaproteobacteria bacterium]MBU2308853.1 superoxide dismutase family protein [Alphaproteobacteria bacterium]